MRSFFKSVVAIIVLFILGFVLFNYWSIIFSKTYKGELLAVEKLQIPVAVLGGRASGDVNDKALFSFAIAIRTIDGKIITASAEDRQWSVVRKGMCVAAKVFPYPPWDFEKGSTYFNARLVEAYDCPLKTSAPEVDLSDDQGDFSDLEIEIEDPNLNFNESTEKDVPLKTTSESGR